MYANCVPHSVGVIALRACVCMCCDPPRASYRVTCKGGICGRRCVHVIVIVDINYAIRSIFRPSHVLYNVEETYLCLQISDDIQQFNYYTYCSRFTIACTQGR
jgi:hypothetical protein